MNFTIYSIEQINRAAKMGDDLSVDLMLDANDKHGHASSAIPTLSVECLPLMSEIKRFYDCGVETEFRLNQFGIGSGQIGRLSWYINDGDAQLRIHLLHGRKFQFVLNTPHEWTESEILDLPSDIKTLAFRAADFMREV